MIDFTLKKGCSKVALNPISYISHSVGTITVVSIALLLVQVILLAVTKSYSSLLLVLVCLAGTLGAESVYYFLWKKGYGSHSWRISIMQGLLCGLLVPSTYPCHVVLIVVFFVFVFSRLVFGDFADSWVNLTAFTVFLLYFVNSSFFPGFQITSSDLQSRNPALVLIQNGTVPVLKCDGAVTEFLNRNVFRFFGVSIPEGYVSLFWDNGSIIPAFRFNLMTLLSSLVLVSFELIDAMIPFLFLLVYGLLVRYAGPFFVGAASFQGDIILAMLTSGTLFFTFYVLQWFGTTPISSVGKFFYGVISGLCGFFIIGLGTSSSGYALTILVMNLVSPVIQVIEDRRLFSATSRKIIPRLKYMKEYDNA